MGPLADLLVDACFLPQWDSEDRSPPTEEKHVREKIDESPAQLASRRPSNSVGFARTSMTSR
jgi:hypothetical protein